MLQQLEQGHFLSQALSGFNNALLMHHQTLQLPIADPLGFPDYQTFTTRIREAIGTHTNLAPLPLNNFLPLRSGHYVCLDYASPIPLDNTKTLRLAPRSKPKPLACLWMNRASLCCPYRYPDVWLPPRFVQPVRVNFRWLSPIMNAKNSTATPIAVLSVDGFYQSPRQ